MQEVKDLTPDRASRCLVSTHFLAAASTPLGKHSTYYPSPQS
jgi:hypothetical protein